MGLGFEIWGLWIRVWEFRVAICSLILGLGFGV